jgi:ribose transport system substrate-binding protein
MKNLFLSIAFTSLCLLIGGCTPNKQDAATTGDSTATPTSSSQSATKTKRIILLNNTESPFWDAARAGMDQATIDLKLADKGFVASMDSNTNEESGQTELLRQYGTQSDIAAVIISPISAANAAIAEELEKLKKKGIIIGCFDSDLSEANQKIRDFYIGTDNVVAGKVLGAAAKAIKPGCEYVQFVGTDAQQNAIERMDGFASVYGIETQKERKLDKTYPSVARDNVRDVISRYSNLSMLVGIWSYNAPAIVDVVSESNSREKFKIVTFDAEPLAIEQMSKGMIDVMVVQNPFGMGYDSVRYAVAKLTKDEVTIKEMFPNLDSPGGSIRNTGLKVVIPDEGSPVTSDAIKEFGEDVVLMKFSEFRDWLTKYKLTGS